MSQEATPALTAHQFLFFSRRFHESSKSIPGLSQQLRKSVLLQYNCNSWKINSMLNCGLKKKQLTKLCSTGWHWLIAAKLTVSSTQWSNWNTAFLSTSDNLCKVVSRKEGKETGMSLGAETGSLTFGFLCTCVRKEKKNNLPAFLSIAQRQGTHWDRTSYPGWETHFCLCRCSLGKCGAWSCWLLALPILLSKPEMRGWQGSVFHSLLPPCRLPWPQGWNASFSQSSWDNLSGTFVFRLLSALGWQQPGGIALASAEGRKPEAALPSWPY